jgi:hypothetical protein
VPGYPIFVGWRPSSGNDVTVLTGFKHHQRWRINDVLK